MERKLRAVMVGAGRIVAQRWAIASIVSGVAIGALSLWAWWDFRSLQSEYLRLETVAPIEERDSLIAAHHNAQFTYGLLLLSAFGTLFSVLGIGVIARTLHATREMTRKSEEASQNQSRAYLHAETLLAVGPGSQRFLHLVIKNTGNTPARWFSVSAAGMAMPPATLNGLDLNLQQGNIKHQGTWHAIGAGDSQSINIHLGEIDWQSMFSQPQQGVVLAVFGTIEYADIYARAFRTDFAFFTPHVMRGPNDHKFSKPLTFLRSYVEIEEP